MFNYVTEKHLNRHYVLVLAAQSPSRLDSFNKAKLGCKLMVRSK